MLANPTARDNMRMDMDLLAEGTEPPTRVPSPRADRANDLFSGSGLFAAFDLGGKAGATGANESAISDTPVSPGHSRATTPAGTPGAPNGDGQHVTVTSTTPEFAKTPELEPKPEQEPEPEPEAVPAPASPPKIGGNLMKDIRNDVQQGAMEFNMDNFF
jgi:hypothetical protein